MRHYLTAYDASLLSSHLYSVLNKDPCVNMLGKFELNVKVHVSRSPGSNNVEIDVLSGGVGKMATAKKREKSEKVIVPCIAVVRRSGLRRTFQFPSVSRITSGAVARY